MKGTGEKETKVQEEGKAMSFVYEVAAIVSTIWVASDSERGMCVPNFRRKSLPTPRG
jgi:hypothetical protein